MTLVPQTRLIVWFALVVLPFSAVASGGSVSLGVSSGVISVFLLVAVIDAFAARAILQDLGVVLPDLVRLQRNRPGQIEVRIENGSARKRSVKIGLSFPPQISTREEEQAAILPDGGRLSSFWWNCEGLERGKFFLDAAFLEGSSPLGFWARRRRLPVRTEIRVYPDLFEEQKRVSALFLNRGRAGVHARRQAGHGREFEKLREYSSGDSLDEIHWKASAKRRQLVTKVFQVERTQEIYILVDGSRLSARRASPGRQPIEAAGRAEPGEQAARTTTLLERYVTSAMVLALAAQQQDDAFGLLTFSDKIHGFLPARTGKTHYNSFRETLYALQPRIVSPDFDELATFVRLRLRKRALLVVLTSLDDPVLAESFRRSVDLLSRQHLVLVNMIAPPGAHPLFEEENVRTSDEVYVRLGGHLLWHNLRELGKILQRRGVRLSLLEDETMSAQLVSQFMDVKQRQLL